MGFFSRGKKPGVYKDSKGGTYYSRPGARITKVFDSSGKEEKLRRVR